MSAPLPRRGSSLASSLGLNTTATPASSLAPPADSPLELTPLRAHYLKRELVTLEFVAELRTLDSPNAVSLLGPPFLPESRFVNGLPTPVPLAGSAEAAEVRPAPAESRVDLPFLRFVFHHFVLSFPFLANCAPTFFSHKLQPFIYSFVSRNISSSNDREEDTKRKRIAGKIEKHLGLIMSAATKLTDNEGREEVVRIEEDGTATAGVPASQAQAQGGTEEKDATTTKQPVSYTAGLPKQETFGINVVSVRNKIVKGVLKNRHHEDFIVRTRRTGWEDIYVSRRYGDFTRLAETVSTAATPPGPSY
jgi:hypothetical protein